MTGYTTVGMTDYSWLECGLGEEETPPINTII